jgi:hypothetical protein
VLGDPAKPSPPEAGGGGEVIIIECGPGPAGSTTGNGEEP